MYWEEDVTKSFIKKRDEIASFCTHSIWPLICHVLVINCIYATCSWIIFFFTKVCFVIKIPRWLPPQDIVLTQNHMEDEMKKLLFADTRNSWIQNCSLYYFYFFVWLTSQDIVNGWQVFSHKKIKLAWT